MGINPNLSSENAPGIQQKNVAWLKAQTELMTAQTKYMEAFNKTKKEDWDAAGGAMKEMSAFSAKGGMMALLGGSIERFKNNLLLSVEAALAPIVNAFTGALSEILVAIEPLIRNLVSALDNMKIGLGDVDFSVLDVLTGLGLLANVLTLITNALATMGTVPLHAEDVITSRPATYWDILLQFGANSPEMRHFLSLQEGGGGGGREGGYQEW